MKEGWKMVKLGEVSSFQNGFAFKSSLFKDKGNPIIRISNIQEGKLCTNGIVYFNPEDYNVDFNQYRIFPNDILIAMSGGTTGKLGINQDNIIYYQNQRVGVIRENPNVLDRQYLYFFLQTKTEESLKIAAGAAQPNLSTAQINNFELPLPPLEEQHRIVGILDAAFAKIDALKKNAEENLKNAKALFQQVLAQELQPKEGWSLVQIRDVALLITKGASPKWQGNKYVEEDGILFVTSENVREGYIDISTPKYVDKTFNLKQQRSILYKDDVLVNIVGASIGRSAIFDLDIIDANINQAVALVRLDKTKLIPRLLCLYLNSNLAFEKYNSMKKDTARANLSLENIGDIELYIPKNITEQHRIVRTLDTLSEKCRRLEQVAQQTIRECDALKQSILRQAFSGEL